MTVGLSPQSPNRYLGPSTYIVNVVTRNRQPTGADYRQPETGKLYSVNSFWQVGKNPTTGVEGEIWVLTKIVANVAYWALITSAGPPVTGPVLTLSDTANTLVPPTAGGNIKLEGTAGQIVITSDALNNKLVFSLTGAGTAVDSFTVQAVTAPGVNPVTPTAAGVVTFNGAAVANHSVPLETRSRALNAMNIEVQYATSAAATDATKSGIAHFNSSQFTVDANGFVALTGGGAAIDQIAVDAATGPGTNPVLPSGTGQVTVTGGQVAPGVIGANVIRTNSLAANTYTIQVQQTSAVAAKDTTKNGVAHFNSAQFTNDEGFISIVGGLPFETVNVQRVTATGAFTYTPTANMKYVIVELCGGGGGSGGVAATTGSIAIAGAGTGAGYAKFLLTAAQVGLSLTGSVGAGGTAGSSGNNAGGNGGDTTLATAAPWTCAGGTGGAGGASGASATVNSAGGGTVTTGTGTVVLAVTGGASGNGAGAAINIAYAGCGGSSMLGVGGAALIEAVVTNSSSGQGGIGYGAGAGGSISYGTAAALPGTAGQPGIAIFTEFC